MGVFIGLGILLLFGFSIAKSLRDAGSEMVDFVKNKQDVPFLK